MKKFLLFGAAIGLGITAMAADFPPLTFEMTDGSTRTLASENLLMTFQDGDLTATNNETTFQAPVTGISKFYFNLDPQGVDGINDDRNSKVEVFNTTGVFMGSFENIDAARTSLAAGLYIMRSGIRTFKTVVK